MDATLPTPTPHCGPISPEEKRKILRRSWSMCTECNGSGTSVVRKGLPCHCCNGNKTLVPTENTEFVLRRQAHVCRCHVLDHKVDEQGKCITCNKWVLERALRKAKTTNNIFEDSKGVASI